MQGIIMTKPTEVENLSNFVYTFSLGSSFGIVGQNYFFLTDLEMYHCDM